jgi:hypothetical protein
MQPGVSGRLYAPAAPFVSCIVQASPTCTPLDIDYAIGTSVSIGINGSCLYKIQRHDASCNLESGACYLDVATSEMFYLHFIHLRTPLIPKVRKLPHCAASTDYTRYTKD